MDTSDDPAAPGDPATPATTLRRSARPHRRGWRGHVGAATRTATGASLSAPARFAGLGRARLRVALQDAGVEVRPPGTNTAAGRRSRADSATAAAVGTHDLAG